GNVSVSNGQFIMPDENVEFTGFFAKNEAPYTVSHYYQLPDGTWGDPQVSYKVDSHEGENVNADYVNVDGYTAFEGHPNTKKSGTVLIDGSLELKFYYKRNTFTVKYEYVGKVPEGATSLPAAETKLWGENVDVAGNATAPGYTFSGWSSQEADVSRGSFIMPQSDVTIIGSFDAKTDTPYRIEHYKELPGGGFASTPDEIENLTGTTGEYAVAHHKNYEGFTPNPDDVLTGIITPSPDTLVIKLYYLRNSYNVYYRYYGGQPEGAPDISLNNLTGVPYGTELSFAAKPTLANHTFNGWLSHQVSVGSDKFTMPAIDVIILGSFVENAKLSVSYEYNGTIPSNAPALPETTLHHPKENITVADAPILSGYTFSGWTSAEVTPVGGKFDMPDVNVVFRGSFTANTGTVYKVEHYKQNLDGTYPSAASETENLTGTTNASVTATPKSYEGFTEDTDHALRIASGTVLADGSLVLKLYYERNSYKVTYKYEGTVPSGASALPAEKTYKFGETVTVAADGYASGYNFIGWVSSDVTPRSGKFTMPAKDVTLRGSFETAATTGYLVIDKELTAPLGFTGGNVFNFKIFRAESTGNKYVKTVSVKAGTPEIVELIPGTYYVVEDKADVSGYALTVFCDDKDNKVNIQLSQVSRISFKNVYVEVQLEKDDHFGYIIGYPDGTVRPVSYITRAEVATIFFRMLTDASRAKVWSQNNSFSDVSASDWFNNAVSTLENAGVIGGYSDGTFRPNLYITRAELVKIAVSFYGTSAGKDTHFSDTSYHWANDFIEAAREMGFVDGYTDGTFRPDQLVTRAEAMKIINRTLDRIPHKDHLHKDMIVWKDNRNKNKWYYAEVQEATNSHIYIWDTTYEKWVRIREVRDWAALEKIWSDAYDG
ncbi:MAG: S-layer homology domain-containing protein, partial [Clostridia bacterium]|nr:S-layer homology domain-containing protein [Clostridia bacterium]